MSDTFTTVAAFMAQVSKKKETYSDPDIDLLLEPFRGMESFVKRGDKVLLKVNLLSAREPKKAVTTHPEIVRAVAKAVRKAGRYKMLLLS